MDSCYLRIAPYEDLLSHSRFLVNLRSQQGKYHPLILFRLSPNHPEEHDEATTTAREREYQQLYAMEAQCPHLGADLSHGEIEECETSLVLVCPWHRYDFDLRTGHSETGLKACTYDVQVRPDPDHPENDIVWIATPDDGTGWRLVELRPVSEEFAETPAPPPDLSHLSLSDAPQEPASAPASPPEPVVPTENPPTTLIQWAVLILNTADPVLKVQRTRHAVHLFRTGQLKAIGTRGPDVPRPPDTPPRPEAFARKVVDRVNVGKRKNRAVMLHALANIEQWAIDLAWDIIARFGPTHPHLPPAFFADFTKVALDESKHFTLLTARLAALSPSTPYGTLPTHAALWSSALATAHSLPARLAIIHLVHEARGLDVNPGTIARFRRAGDAESVGVLETVHSDEVTHVAAGHRWFVWWCEREGEEPVKRFREEVRRAWCGEVKGPFNVGDRERAGLSKEYYEDLRGEAAYEGEREARVAASVSVGYEDASR